MIDWAGPSVRRCNSSLGLVRITSEERYFSAVLGGYVDIVDAGAPGSALLRGLGDEDVAQLCRFDERDLPAERHCHAVACIAGEREGTVGEGEDQAAMTGIVAVQHILAHGHAKPGMAWSDGLDRHAKCFRGPVLRIHCPPDIFREALVFGLSHRRADIAVSMGEVARHRQLSTFEDGGATVKKGVDAFMEILGFAGLTLQVAFKLKLLVEIVDC